MNRLHIGARCIVHGLKNSTELNGRVVTILAFGDTDGWFDTDARADEEVVSVIHERNLRLIKNPRESVNTIAKAES